MSSAPVVEVQDLTFRYYGSNSRILNGIDLALVPGELVVVAGHSGSGKSTLLRSMNGLIPHQHAGEYGGRVVVDGLEVAKTKMSELARKVGYVFQNPENQIFMFSVERDIAFGLENLGFERGEIRRRVDETMELLGISDLALRAPHELSDGQKQRVAIAGVLAMEPSVLILDEPTSLLDPFTATELVNLVSSLQRRLGMTVVVVEHRLDLLAKIASRIVVLDGGRIVSDGPPRQALLEADVALHGVTEPTIVKLSKLSGVRRRDGSLPIDAAEMSESILASSSAAS